MISDIALHIGCNLSLPFVRELYAPSGKAPTMPEVAIDKDGHPCAPEDKVRPPGKITGVSIEASPGPLEHQLDLPFGSCITPLDASHQGAPLLGAHDIATMQSFVASVHRVSLQILSEDGGK